MNASLYLSHIYDGPLDAGSRALMRFYAEVYCDSRDGTLLEFGGGPALYSVISAARTMRAIHFADPSDECLEEIQKWRQRDVHAFNWRRYTRYAIWCETGCSRRPSKCEAAEREELVRRRLTQMTKCDAFASDPMVGLSSGPYDAVASNFCLDGITDSLTEWKVLVERLSRLVAPSGLFVMTAVRRGTFWGQAGERFPAVYLDVADVGDRLTELGFRLVHADAVDLAGRPGYDGIIMAAGRK